MFSEIGRVSFGLNVLKQHVYKEAASKNVLDNMEKRDLELLRDVLSASRQSEMLWKNKYPFLMPMVWYDKDSVVYHFIDYLVQKYNPKTMQKAFEDYYSNGFHISFTALVQQAKTTKSENFTI